MNPKIVLYVAGAYSGNIKENIQKAEEARCDALFVMANSEGSNGVKKEIEFALKCGMPIVREKDFPSEKFAPDDFARVISKK